MRRSLFVVLCLALLTGCIDSGQQANASETAKDAGAIIDSDNDGYTDDIDAFPFDPTRYTKKVLVGIGPLSSGVDVTYKNVIADAMAYWSARDGYIFKEYNESRNETGYGYVYVSWAKEYSSEHIGTYWGTTQDDALITIGLGDTYCMQKWQPYTYDTVARIARHEFGHLLGYNHSDDPNDLMYNFTTTKYVLDFNESDVLSPSWASFYPICSRLDPANYTFELSSFYNLDFFVISSRTDYDSWMLGEYYATFPKSYYPECSKTGVHKYAVNCVLNSSGGVVLYNNYEGVTVAFNITAKED